MKTYKDFGTYIDEYKERSLTNQALNPEAAARQSSEKMELITERSEAVIHDTSAALHPQFQLMLEHLLPIMQAQGKAVRVRQHH